MYNVNFLKRTFMSLRMIKRIIERIIKALPKSKIIYSFELMYSHGLVSWIASLSMFLLRKPESLLLAGLAKSF